MAPVYSEGAAGALIVFDVTRRETLNSIPAWIKCLSQCDPGITILIIANKCDIEDREISFDEGEAYARGLNSTYFETSAANGAGVEEAFGFIAERIFAAVPTTMECIRLPDAVPEVEKSGCC
jgi:Ras-related protein Rab-2A